jgi:hypothetical protein
VEQGEDEGASSVEALLQRSGFITRISDCCYGIPQGESAVLLAARLCIAGCRGCLGNVALPPCLPACQQPAGALSSGKHSCALSALAAHAWCGAGHVKGMHVPAKFYANPKLLQLGRHPEGHAGTPAGRQWLLQLAPAPKWPSSPCLLPSSGSLYRSQTLRASLCLPLPQFLESSRPPAEASPLPSTSSPMWPPCQVSRPNSLALCWSASAADMVQLTQCPACQRCQTEPNLLCTAGIVGASIGMPDIHSGYGFAIGRPASLPPASCRHCLQLPAAVPLPFVSGNRMGTANCHLSTAALASACSPHPIAPCRQCGCI